MAKKYVVIIIETSFKHRQKAFKAGSEAEARRKAEAEDWRTWDETGGGNETSIESIVEVKE